MNRSEKQFDPGRYWEERGRRFARSGSGWKAVCLKGAPEFYNRLLHRLQRKALLPEFDSSGAVLEFGCGVGRWLEELNGRFGKICGIDISPAMLERARQRLGRPAGGDIRLCRFDGSRIPFSSGVFDLVFSVTVLIHVVDDGILRRAIGEICRVAAPGGKIVILEDFASDGESSLPHLRFRPEGAVEALFLQSGWRLVSSRPVYFIFPPEQLLRTKPGRILTRLALPGYYLLNRLNQELEFSRRPVQKIQVYRRGSGGAAPAPEAGR